MVDEMKRDGRGDEEGWKRRRRGMVEKMKRDARGDEEEMKRDGR
jgi:hypothetical protein